MLTAGLILSLVAIGCGTYVMFDLIHQVYKKPTKGN